MRYFIMAERTPLHEPTNAAGAVFVEEAGFRTPAHFGDVLAEYNAAHNAAILVDQSQRGKIEVRGADAARFLHNLTTNDILHLSPGSGCEAFLTTTKAKVVAYLLIYRAASAELPVFDIDVAPGAGGKVIAHLDRYLISEQVEFADHTAPFAQMHLAGPRAATVLRAIFDEVGLPAEALRHVAVRFDDADGWLRRHDALGLPGYDLVCPAKQAVSLWQRLTQAGARPAGRDACEILRIEAGLPREGADIDENTFAPEVGRIAETICYTKGCYLGQESIVMARDRGQVNRALVGVKLMSGPVPHGSLLFADGKEVGRVTSSVSSSRLSTGLGLAYVRRGHQAAGTTRPATPSPSAAAPRAPSTTSTSTTATPTRPSPTPSATPATAASAPTKTPRSTTTPRAAPTAPNSSSNQATQSPPTAKAAHQAAFVLARAVAFALALALAFVLTFALAFALAVAFAFLVVIP
jgi:folate-binding protein YgfZ